MATERARASTDTPRAGEGGREPRDRPGTTPETREILNRLRSVEGHVRGVARMVDEDAYCMDVVNQIRGVERALKKVTALVLDRHLHSCATAAIRGDDPGERERVIRELLETFTVMDRA